MGGRRFYDHARTSPQLAKALSEMVHEGRTNTFRAMALDYKRQSAGKADTSHWTRAGFETMVDRSSGDLLVRQPGKNWVKASSL